MINRQGVTLSVLGCSFALVVACSSDNPGFIVPNASGGSSATGNRPSVGNTGGRSSGGGGRENVVGRGGAGGAGDAGGVGGASGGKDSGGGGKSAAAPAVVIKSPAEVTDPNKGPVVLEKVRVECEAKASDASSATFSASSVAIEVFDADGKSVQKLAGTKSIGDANVFFAEFVISRSQVPSGAISFKCSANDLSTPPKVGSDVVNTFIDHGPVITVTSPALPNMQNALEYRALSTAVPFRFTVVPDPLSPKDTQAAVKQVTLMVANQSIDLSAAELPTSKGTYQLDLQLDDKEKFKITPNGVVPVEIVATNKRSPTPADHPVEASLAYNFGVDGAGPQVTITSPSPLNAPVVGVAVKLQFTVKDAESGVDPSTVNVTLTGDTPKFYDSGSANWSRNGDSYTYNIANTTAVSDSKIQLSVVIQASDNSKNKSLAATAQYWLDTSAPIVDLDPPLLQEVKPSNSPDGRYCSDPFDVLGPVAPSEGDVLPSANLFRALVWDTTNSTDGQPIFHYAGVDTSSVRLYAQDDPSQPLLIDTNNDGICDALATEGTQGVVHPPVPVELHPLDASGDAVYSTSSPELKGFCSHVTSDSTPPPKLCLQHVSDMRRIIDHAIAGAKEDVIYTVTSGSELECTGKVIDITSSVDNGWVCLAAEAQDVVGNHGISAPIRVCLSGEHHPEPACKNSSVEMPSCVAKCTPPGHFAASYVTRTN